MLLGGSGNQESLKLNGTPQPLGYADDVNMLGRSVLHTVKENTDALVVASQEIGLEVNDDKTKYIVMS
jgi:hypothetical protein